MTDKPNVLDAMALEADIRRDPVKWAMWKLKDIKGNPWTARWYQRDLLHDVAFNSINKLAVRMGRRVGKCLVGDTLIFDPTTGKRHRIEDLYDDQSATVATMNKRFKLETTSNVHIVENGVKQIAEVKLKSGKKIKTTGNHPLYRVDGWVEVKDLSPGDKVATPRELNHFGQRDVSDEVVKLLAYMTGDGNTTRATLRFSSACDRITKEFTEVVDSFGDAVVKQYASNKDCDFNIVSRDGFPKTRYKNTVRRLMEEHELFGRNALQKKVPDAILEAPREKVSLFLSRLYATDGWASSTSSGKKHMEIGYCTSSEQLAFDVQHLLLRFGIHSVLREKMVKYKGSRNKTFVIGIHSCQDVQRFAKEIGIFSKELALDAVVDVSRTMKAKDDAVPVEIMQEVERLRVERRIAPKAMLHPNASMNDRYRKQYSPQRKTLDYWADVLGSERLKDLANSDIYWDEIESIEYIGHEQTFDLSVPDTKNFVANDIIVHNTETMCVYMLWRAMHNKNERLLVATPYENQVALIFRRLKELIATSDELKDAVVREVSNPYIIEFANGTAIMGFTVGATSGNSGASIRGQRADFLFLDEVDFMSRDGVDATIAITYENPKHIGVWASSTPIGKRDFFYEICTKPETGYKPYHYPSTVNPDFDEEMEGEFRATMTEQGYIHEVLAEFGEETMGVFGKAMVERAKDQYLYSYRELNVFEQKLAKKNGYDIEKIDYIGPYTLDRPAPRAVRILGADWDKELSPSGVILSTKCGLIAGKALELFAPSARGNDCMAQDNACGMVIAKQIG